jgi:hypothetical protein
LREVFLEIHNKKPKQIEKKNFYVNTSMKRGIITKYILADNINADYEAV